MNDIKELEKFQNHLYELATEVFEELGSGFKEDTLQQGLSRDDPACGTGGMLLECVDHLKRENAEQSPKAALTELFQELKNDKTPAVVERIVDDIDSIVRLVRFNGWQTTSAGEREVQRSLRRALLKYKLHTDQVLFDRAYTYIQEDY